jgi:hypothetical protein
MGDGLLMAFVRDECRVSERMAQIMMKAARDVASNPQLIAHLNAGRITVTAIDTLLSSTTTPEVRDQVEAILVDGQKVTAADVKRPELHPWRIERHRPHLSLPRK